MDRPRGAAIIWVTPYVVLAPLGVYRLVWEYDAKTLWSDFSAHLLYGAVAGLSLRALTR